MSKFYTVLSVLLLLCLGLQAQNLVNRTLLPEAVQSARVFRFPNETAIRFVELNTSLVNEKKAVSVQVAGFLDLDLAYVRTYFYAQGSSSWYAQSTRGTGDMILSFYQGYVNGIIVDDQGRKFMLQQIGKSNQFALSEVAVESMQESPAAQPDYIAVEQPSGKKTRVNPDVCAVGNACAGSSVIDIMVLGAAAAITNGGGSVASFTANVTSAITQMNTAFTNSGGTNLTFNLVHCKSTAFATTANMNADLTNFAGDAGVQALRNTHHADLVGLWAGSGSYAGFCGLGYLNTNPTNYSSSSAYTVTDYGCGMTNLTFAHECGHNMGLRHDYYVDGGLTPCSHHHGYVNQVVIPGGLPNTARWRTIMAYNNHCSDNGFNCSRVARWANPAVNYLGDPTGVAIGQPSPSNEIYGFERFRCVVSEFRTNPLPVQLISFTAGVQGTQINLHWTSALETAFAGYEVEMKRTVDEDFKPLTFIPALDTQDPVHAYRYTVPALLPGRYYFRLRMVDLDQQFAYSPVVTAELSGQSLEAQLFPNPNNGQFTLSGFNPKRQVVRSTLYDYTGRKVKDILNGEMEAGQFSVDVQTLDVPKGSYLCELRGGQERQMISVSIR